MDMTELAAAAWQRSSYSSANGECVEVAAIPGRVAMRDSKNMVSGVLVVAVDEFAAFVQSVRDGGFDQAPSLWHVDTS